MKTILVADDEPDMLQIIGVNLKYQGYDVTTAGNGMEALRIARTKPITAIILDIMMPEIDGYEVCRLLKLDERTRNIPIIMVTALHSKIARITGLDAGAVDFISKPFSPQELTHRLARLLSADFPRL